MIPTYCRPAVWVFATPTMSYFHGREVTSIRSSYSQRLVVPGWYVRRSRVISMVELPFHVPSISLSPLGRRSGRGSGAGAKPTASTTDSSKHPRTMTDLHPLPDAAVHLDDIA